MVKSWSVALCTYNGARYIAEQLQSIAAQTRLPHEVLICDDGSSDETGSLVRQFASSAPFEVRWQVNASQLGASQNFGRAIGLCSGDLIALADQDDLWHPEKLERLEARFDDSGAAGAVFTDAALVGSRAEPLGSTMWSYLEFGADERRDFASGVGYRVLARRNVITGATLAFRRSLTDLVLPIPPPWMHDHWIGLIVSCVSGVVADPATLIDYRQHAAQQIGTWRGAATGPSPALAESWTKDLVMLGIACERLSKRGVDGETKGAAALAFLDSRRGHLEARLRTRRSGWGRVPIVAKELVDRRYHSHSRGLRSALRDLILAR